MKCVLGSILALAAVAQTPPAEPPAGSLSGVIKEATTRVPLEGVRVWAGKSDATTGPQGQFALPKLEPGRHWVSVYDESRAASGGKYILLNPGQDLTGVEILVKTGGSISGRVFDEDRRPVAGAEVVLLEAAFELGQTVYRAKLTQQTNRNGEYKLEPVPSERGFLLLTTQGVPAGRGNRPSLTPAFYPGSPDVQGAQPLTLGAGEERRGVDIQMTSAPAYCIGGEARATAVTITEQLPSVFGSWLAPVTIPISKGHFRACGFHPGEYRVEATGPDIFRNQRWSASADVAITDHDIRDLQVVPDSAMALAGETAWEPPPRGEAPAERILIGLKNLREKHAEETQRGAFYASRHHASRVRIPGPFVLDGLSAAEYALEVGQIPEGCYVKDATSGGASVLHQPLRLTQGAEASLHIALACDGASLTARVTDRDGNPMSHVNLYVMPEEADAPAALFDVLKLAQVENGWSEIVKPLPPGKYLVLACDLGLDGTAEPILKLWRWRSKAKEVEIGSGGMVQVTLELVEGGL